MERNSFAKIKISKNLDINFVGCQSRTRKSRWQRYKKF